MRVKALHKLYYNRRDVLPGETFDMDDREHNEAKILSMLGKLEILPSENKPQAAPQKLEMRALKAEPPPQEPAPPAPAEVMTTGSADALTGRRTYRRRDLKAEQ